jgi:ATP-binding cassette, subfamily F, member 3
VGDETTALESVLKADVWRDRLMSEEKELNAKLTELEAEDDSDRTVQDAKEEAATRLAEVHSRLTEMEAESGPARAALLLAGLGFSEMDQRRETKTFSGGWRMRLALARALFVKPDLLMLGMCFHSQSQSWFLTSLGQTNPLITSSECTRHYHERSGITLLA